MPLPTFLIIGAAKSGTTALYEALAQHPEVYMSPIKEPNFFALEGRPKPPGGRDVVSLPEYLALFEGASGRPARGEASPLYLVSERAPERIRHYVPDARLVAILRHPADRAYSNYLHDVREGRESAPFAQVVEDELAGRRASAPWFHRYVENGFYHRLLARYFGLFPREQIRVYLYDDLERDPRALFRDFFAFIGVAPDFAPDLSIRPNTGGIPRSRWLYAKLVAPNRLKTAVKTLLRPFLGPAARKRLWYALRERNLVRPPLDPALRARLVEIYRDDILALEKLLGRDLSRWLAPAEKTRAEERAAGGAA